MHLHRNRKGLLPPIVFLSSSIILLVLLFPRTAAINLPPESLLFFTYVTILRVELVPIRVVQFIPGRAAPRPYFHQNRRNLRKGFHASSS